MRTWTHKQISDQLFDEQIAEDPAYNQADARYRKLKEMLVAKRVATAEDITRKFWYHG